MDAQRTLAPALGWFSMALGAAEIAMPKQVARAIGTDGNALLMRGLGVRELSAGVAVLSRRNPAPGLWARVAGDAMDLALLGTALRNERNERSRVGIALASVAAIAALDLVAALSPSVYQRDGRTPRPDFTKSVSMYLAPEDLFDVLADPSTYCNLMPGFDDAQFTLLDSERPLRLSWKVEGARAFAGRFDIEIREQEPVKGTAMRLDAYSTGSMLGPLRRVIAEFPGDEVSLGLRRLKNIAEVGYIVSNDGPSGRGKVEVGP